MIRKLSSTIAAAALALAAAPALAQSSADGAQQERRDCCARMHCNTRDAALSESAATRQARVTSPGGVLQNDPHAKSYVNAGG